MPRMLRVRATLLFAAGSPGLYTAYFREPASPILADAQSCADRVRGAWDVFKTSMTTSTGIQVQAGVDILDDLTGTLVGAWGTTAPALVSGTVTGALGAPQVMGGVRLFTSDISRGRKVAGHSFLGPLPAATVGSSTPPAGLLTNLAAFGVALNGVGPSTPRLVVWQRPAPGGLSGGMHDVTATQPGSKWYTLRSRLN